MYSAVLLYNVLCRRRVGVSPRWQDTDSRLESWSHLWQRSGAGVSDVAETAWLS